MQWIKHFLFRAYANAYFLLPICAICWGANCVAARFAVGEISPMLLTFLRWLGISILLFGFTNARISKELPIIRQYFVYFFLMGTLGFTLFNVLLFLAAHFTTALNIGILQGGMPVFVLIGSYFVYQNSITLVQLVGVSLAVIGVILVTAGGDLVALRSMNFNGGDILMLGACGMYAAYAVFLRGRPKISGLSMFAIMAAAATLASVPFVIWEWVSDDTIWPTLVGWSVVLFVIMFPSFIAQLFFLRGVELVGPGRAGLFINLVPIFAAIFSVLILGEIFEWFHATALILVLSGIYLFENLRQSP